MSKTPATPKPKRAKKVIWLSPLGKFVAHQPVTLTWSSVLRTIQALEKSAPQDSVHNLEALAFIRAAYDPCSLREAQEIILGILRGGFTP